jgi:hypothetical protein
MDKKKKLSIVFDFIADYLSESENETNLNSKGANLIKKLREFKESEINNTVGNTGITLDDNGKIIKVAVKPLKSVIENQDTKKF